jgi:hypothetical protein
MGASRIFISTLVQIESAVTALPPQDQSSLLTWLQGRLKQAPVSALPSTSATPEWLSDVRALRERCSTGASGTPVAQLITEIRS